MQGYWQPDGTLDNSIVLDDGWLDTGDVAVQDEDGYFRIISRKKTPSSLANTPFSRVMWKKCFTKIRACWKWLWSALAAPKTGKSESVCGSA